MQIKLDRATEQVLEAQATASENPSRDFDIKTHQDALIWILSRNPNIQQNRPQDIDWQQLKAEGRRVSQL